jgi:hypothetical protein
MIVRLQKIETTSGDSPVSSAPSAEPAMIADQMNAATLTPPVKPNRRLRNRIILANVAAWVLIVLAIRLIFF